MGLSLNQVQFKVSKSKDWILKFFLDLHLKQLQASKTSLVHLCLNHNVPELKFHLFPERRHCKRIHSPRTKEQNRYDSQRWKCCVLRLSFQRFLPIYDLLWLLRGMVPWRLHKFNGEGIENDQEILLRQVQGSRPDTEDSCERNASACHATPAIVLE